MRLQGSCHCGKVRFSVESTEPVPFMRCYCSICRKTAGGGGYAINLGAVVRSMQVTGKRDLRIYRAALPADGADIGKAGKDGKVGKADKKNGKDGQGAPLSEARRYFCAKCGSALWVWDPRWPELVHPHASAIDTPLPPTPEHVHIMLGSKVDWVPVEGSPTDPHFESYPDMSLAQWHERQGLASSQI